MKNHFVCFLIMMASFTSLQFAHSTDPQMDLSFQVYPKEIRWGDLFFVRLTVSNKEDRSINVIRQRGYEPTDCMLFSENEAFYHWFTPEKTERLEGVFCIASTEYPARHYLLKPQEESVIYFFAFWMPVPDHPADQEAEMLRQRIGDTGETFVFKTEVQLRSGFSTGNDDARNVWKMLPENDSIYPLETTITVKPRTENELSLLRNWFQEIPYTNGSHGRMPHNLFAHSFHVHGSPYHVQANSPEEYQKKREPLYKKMLEFFKSMETRTPESLARIKRTNELASALLKLPDSELSTNMKEFIQLRGFLVDMRYAENEEMEKAAFEKMCEFVAEAKDKELWTQLVTEIGFASIQHHEYFPYMKVEEYKKLFRDRFDVNRVLR